MRTTTSSDGTTIAYDTAGSGPPVILIGGAFNDHATMTGLAEVLAPHFTAYTYDRRGRGASTDSASYDVRREVEDLSALIDLAGGQAALFGHSSGAALALHAAAGGAPVTALALYEPPYAVPGTRPLPSADLAEQLSALLARNERDEAVGLFLRDAVGVPAEVVAGMRQAPFWEGMRALAHTLPYDVTVTGPRSAVPVDLLARISVPTLVLDGSASDAPVRTAVQAVAAALPGAAYQTLDGQDHGVLHQPQALDAPLRTFLMQHAEGRR